MSWFRVDDGMLDHPKWIKAIREGGDAALHLWLRAGTWSSRHLTDGVIPPHVVASLPGPRGGKTRARAWQALADASLIHRRDDGEVTLHDYLEYNPSRAEVLAQKQRKAKNKRDQRLRDEVTGDSRFTFAGDVTGESRCPLPSPPLDLSLSDDDGEGETGGDTAAELRPVPLPAPPAVATPEAMNRTLIGVGPGYRALVDAAAAAAAAAEPGTISWLPDDWRPDESDYAAAVMAGCTRAGVDECVTYWRGRKLGGDWKSPSAWLAGKLASIRDREAIARKRSRDEAARGSSRGNGNPGAYVPDPPKPPSIEIDPRYPPDGTFDFCLQHDLGDPASLVRQFIAALNEQGITSMPRAIAAKSFAQWLKARVAR